MLHIDSTERWHQDLIPVVLDSVRNDKNVRIFVEKLDQQSGAIFAEPSGVHCSQSPLTESMELLGLRIDILIGHEESFVRVYKLTLLVTKSSDAYWLFFRH